MSSNSPVLDDSNELTSLANDLYERMVSLSWKILEAKYWYYYRSQPKITDYEYDTMEKEYEAICKRLEIEPTASNMVDFDEKRPSCMHIMLKHGYKINKKRKKK